MNEEIKKLRNDTLDVIRNSQFNYVKCREMLAKIGILLIENECNHIETGYILNSLIKFQQIEVLKEGRFE